MVLSNVFVDITTPCHSFVFGRSRAKVSAGFTNVRSLAVAAFGLVYCSLSVLQFVLFVNGKYFFQDEPTLKLKKVEVAAVDHVTSLPESSPVAATPGSLKVISDMVAVTNSKPLSRTTTQVAMAGKPVATVPPMAAAKTTITTNTQPNISAKPKVSAD